MLILCVSSVSCVSEGYRDVPMQAQGERRYVNATVVLYPTLSHSRS